MAEGDGIAPGAWAPPSDPALPAPPPLGALPSEFDPPAAPAPSRRRPGRLIAVGVVGALLVGGLGGLVGARLAGGETTTRVIRDPLEIPGDRLDVAAIVELLSPSVVTINAGAGQNRGSSVGTGVVLSPEGEIVTNAHVVDGRAQISVLIAGEREPRIAAVVASDPNNDLAVIRLDDPTGVVPAAFDITTDVQVGDDVVAIGYALDLDGAASVTRGIVSALSRNLETDDAVLDGLIQTDAAISSGNSGGPLVNARGEVIGINTATVRSGGAVAANGIGFAIAMSEAWPVLERLRSGDGADGAPIAAGFLGVDLANRDDGGTGAVIVGIAPGTPAEAAGLQPDDLVVAVDGTPIVSAAGLAAAIRDSAPGDGLTLEVLRLGEPLTVAVTLVERSTD